MGKLFRLMTDGEVKHNCYVVVSHTLHDAYAMSCALEHRGKDSTGVFAVGPEGIDVLKWKGSAKDFGNKALQKIFPSEKYHTFGMHGRYRSKGSRELSLDEGHPHVIGGIRQDLGSHIYIKGCKKALIHNGQFEESYFSRLDRSAVKTGSDSEAALHFYEQFGIEALIRTIPDGYTLAIADVDSNGVIIGRGRCGLKPGVMGTKDGFDCFASESVALREIRATLRGDIFPGAIYHLRPNGKMSVPNRIVLPVPRHCFFEYQYIAHPLSSLDRLNVTMIRQDLGEKLAEEFHPTDADLVTYNPESPKDAAIAYADKVGLPVLECFYKVNSDRSFQAPTQEARKDSINTNLHILPDVIPQIRGKVVIDIDDSFVRGTVARRSRHLLYNVAGVSKAYLLSYTPKIGIMGSDGLPRGCDFGGVDMPSIEDEQNKFMARGRTDAEINEFAGAEVYFMSVKGLADVYKNRGMPFQDLCTFCIGGAHPFKDLK